MASLYKRNRSPFWWIKWRNPETGAVEQFSTKFRVGIGEDWRKAKTERDFRAAKETKIISRAKGESFSDWVPSFLKAKYNVPDTLRRAGGGWENIHNYFGELQIKHPREVKRSHCLGYLSWRKSGSPAKGIKPCSHNNALLDLVYLRVVLAEAVARGIIDHNPCLGLGLRKERPRPKQEITEEEIEIIRQAIQNPTNYVGIVRHGPVAKYNWPHILRVTFEVGMAQGCRISETYLDLQRDIDLRNMEITFHAKGNKHYTTALNPCLVPLIIELREQGQTMTYLRPKQKNMVSLYWHKFLKRIGLPHLSFHCTRVTAISRLERSGAPESVVMQMVNHASTTVHRIYRRYQQHELRKFWEQSNPSVSANTTSLSETQGAPPATPLPTHTSSPDRE